MGEEPERREPTRDEVAAVVHWAEKLVKAHEARSPSSKNATLGELDALFNLGWEINRLPRSKYRG